MVHLPSSLSSCVQQGCEGCSPGVLACWAITATAAYGGFEPQKLVSSQFRRLDVQDQGVSRVSLQGLSSWLVGGHFLSVCLHGGSSVHAHVCARSLPVCPLSWSPLLTRTPVILDWGSPRGRVSEKLEKFLGKWNGETEANS